ncbi:MAG: glycosyltransferase family 4 protein [Actinomycetota bacterium]|nr:glycosyltransferase family 4 protein [Actinomycetota bacterium]
MRVAVDVTPLLGAPTGVSQSLRGLLGGLAATQPGVEIRPYVLSARALRRREAVVEGLGASALPLPAGLAIRRWGRGDRPAADRWLDAADVVHGSNFVVPPMRRRPTTATVHDCWCARNPERCSPDVAALTSAVRRSVRRGTWLHVTTEHGAREVAEVYGVTERVAVVPFAVPGGGEADAGRGVPEPVAGRRYVLALGALDPRKGLTGLVRAFGVVAALDPDVLLVLAGPDGPARAGIGEALAGLDPAVAARVHLLGTVDDGARRALLAGAAVLAYPSLDEGFGFPVLEAMAAGTPVVSSRAGALPEVAGDAAALVPVGDDASLAATLLSVLTDDARRARLVAAGTTRAAHFTWARTAAGLTDLWRRAVEAGS